MSKYPTAESLEKAVHEYFEDIPTMQMMHRGDTFPVQCVDMFSVSRALGFKTRQSLYDLEKKGPDFKKAVDIAREYIIRYWLLMGNQGSANHANRMLVKLGEFEPETKRLDHSSSDGSMRPTTIQLVGPDDQSES